MVIYERNINFHATIIASQKKSRQIIDWSSWKDHMFAKVFLARSINFRKKRWSHCFSKNVNQKLEFCPVVWHSTGQKSVQFLGSCFGRNDDFINSFWNLLTFKWSRIKRSKHLWPFFTVQSLRGVLGTRKLLCFRSKLQHVFTNYISNRLPCTKATVYTLGQ